MNFSGLEAMLIAAISAFISSLFTLWKMSGRFVTKDECKVHRAQDRLNDDHFGVRLDDFKAEMRKEFQDMNKSLIQAKKDSNIQFKMLRSIVTYLPDIEPQTRAKILNEGNGG